MNMHEVVGAVIEAVGITCNALEIDRYLATGWPVEFITRHRAQERAKWYPSSTWAELAKSPTLFLLDQGARFRPA